MWGAGESCLYSLSCLELGPELERFPRDCLEGSMGGTFPHN